MASWGDRAGRLQGQGAVASPGDRIRAGRTRQPDAAGFRALDPGLPYPRRAGGQGCPDPHFDGQFAVLGWRVVGERHLKLELGLSEPGHAGLRLNAIHFGGWSGTPPPERGRIAYRLETGAVSEG